MSKLIKRFDNGGAAPSDNTQQSQIQPQLQKQQVAQTVGQGYREYAHVPIGQVLNLVPKGVTKVGFYRNNGDSYSLPIKQAADENQHVWVKLNPEGVPTKIVNYDDINLRAYLDKQKNIKSSSTDQGYLKATPPTYFVNQNKPSGVLAPLPQTVAGNGPTYQAQSDLQDAERIRQKQADAYTHQISGDALDYFKAGTGNLLSLSSDLNNLYNLGKKPWSIDNSGVVTENFQREHPIVSNLINGAVDMTALSPESTINLGRGLLSNLPRGMEIVSQAMKPSSYVEAFNNMSKQLFGKVLPYNETTKKLVDSAAAAYFATSGAQDIYGGIKSGNASNIASGAIDAMIGADYLRPLASGLKLGDAYTQASKFTNKLGNGIRALSGDYDKLGKGFLATSIVGAVPSYAAAKNTDEKTDANGAPVYEEDARHNTIVADMLWPLGIYLLGKPFVKRPKFNVTENAAENTKSNMRNPFQWAKNLTKNLTKKWGFFIVPQSKSDEMSLELPKFIGEKQGEADVPEPVKDVTDATIKAALGKHVNMGNFKGVTQEDIPQYKLDKYSKYSEDINSKMYNIGPKLSSINKEIRDIEEFINNSDYKDFNTFKQWAQKEIINCEKGITNYKKLLEEAEDEKIKEEYQNQISKLEEYQQALLNNMRSQENFDKTIGAMSVKGSQKELQNLILNRGKLSKKYETARNGSLEESDIVDNINSLTTDYYHNILKNPTYNSNFNRGLNKALNYSLLGSPIMGTINWIKNRNGNNGSVLNSLYNFFTTPDSTNNSNGSSSSDSSDNSAPTPLGSALGDTTRTVTSQPVDTSKYTPIPGKQ